MFDKVLNRKWKIFEMEQCDPDFIDLILGFIEFLGGGFCAHPFGYVYAGIHLVTEHGKAESFL